MILTTIDFPQNFCFHKKEKNLALQNGIIATFSDETPFSFQETESPIKTMGDLGEPFFLSLDGTPLPFINPALGIYSVPTIGYYCDTYPAFEIKMLVKRDGNKESLRKHFPLELQKLLVEANSKNIEFYFIISSTEAIHHAIKKNGASPIINLLYHAWKFPFIGLGETHNVSLNMGMFDQDCIGVYPSPSNGIAFNQLSPQSVIPHPANEGTMCCSPNNACFLFDPQSTYNDCWTAAQDENRWIISYNLLLHDSKLSEEISAQLEWAQDLLHLEQILRYLAETLKRKDTLWISLITQPS